MPVMRSVTPPPPPKNVTQPKRPSPKDLVNYKTFEADKPHAQVIEDLRMSDDSDETTEKGEDDVSDCIGWNRIFPDP